MLHEVCTVIDYNQQIQVSIISNVSWNENMYMQY